MAAPLTPVVRPAYGARDAWQGRAVLGAGAEKLAVARVGQAAGRRRCEEKRGKGKKCNSTKASSPINPKIVW